VTRAVASRSLRALILCAVTSGCVYTGWGTFPFASGEGVEPLDQSDAKVTTPDIEARVEVRTYRPSFVFFGLILPVIPFLPALIGPGWTPERLDIAIFLTGGSDSGFVQPDSLRVVLHSHEYEPLSIKAYCEVRIDTPDRPRWRNDCRPDAPVPAKSHGLIMYDFTYLPSPREPFSIVVKGLPRIDFEPKTRWLFGGGGE
jgi:hypothetical protein